MHPLIDSLKRLFSRREDPSVLTSDHQSANALLQESEPVTIAAAREATLGRVLTLSGCAEPSLANIKYLAKFSSAGRMDYKTLVRDGEILDSGTKKALGVRTRAFVGSDFFAILNTKGKTDPTEAASRICSIYNRQMECLSDLARGPSYIDGDRRLKFFPSNMAAGPCQEAKRRSKKLVNPGEADLLPLQSCQHPDQCGCRYLMKDYTW